MFSLSKAKSDFNKASLPLHMETSCGVVLVNLGTVLLLQYPQGHWDFPKGHVEDSDADHFETTRRELLEETGIEEI
ncbi:MAG: NUDIX domain-containing protein, partial [Candidatus Poseidoniales archaeon]